MRLWKAFGCVCLTLITIANAGAHHSFAALFDTKRTVTLTGQVTEFEFQAPHSYIHLNVADGTGALVAWEIETATPGMLLRIGITPENLRPGQTITVSGNPTRDGRPLIRLLSITMPDGAELQVQE